MCQQSRKFNNLNIMSKVTSFTPVVNIGEWLRANSTHLYKSNRVVLREVLQNAVDATRMSSGFKKLPIEITYNSSIRRLTIVDGGVGMSLEDQQNCFWKPYGSKKRELPGESRMNSGVIGRFGIGAYAAFRTAKQITVVSKPESQLTGQATGTRASLAKPLKEYSSHQSPEISFEILASKDVADVWPVAHSHGTVIVMDLVENLDESEAVAWLHEASAYLREHVTFQGTQVNQPRCMHPKITDMNAREMVVDVSKYCSSKTLKLLKLKVITKANGRASVEICSASVDDGTGIVELPCKGVLKLPPKQQPAGITLLKHQFQFSEMDDTESWVRAVRKDSNTERAFEFDGLLDLPFLDPDVTREGFSEDGQSDMSALLICVSHVIINELGDRGGECLRGCEQLFDVLRCCKQAKQEEILHSFPFQLFPGKQRVTLDELKKQKATNEDLCVVFITEEASDTSEQLAKSLSTLTKYRVIKLDGPEYWRGYVQSKILEGCFGAQNIASATSFQSVLPDEEIGRWREYRAAFTVALDSVIGTGHQIQLARIEPKNVVVVVQEGTGVVYLNYNNPEVVQLPSQDVFGVSLEAKIRSWVFGKIEASKLEDALVKEGKLVIVQKVVSIHYVDQSDGNYIPEPNHQFLLIKKKRDTYFGLRASSLCESDIRGYVDATGTLKDGFSSQLTWIGSTFHYTVQHEQLSIPTLVLTFHTGVALRNSSQDDSIDGRSPFNFQLDVFQGPHLTGTVSFFVLPKWIGELLEQQRVKHGNVMISMWSRRYTPADSDV